jgi:hypothetical protein
VDSVFVIDRSLQMPRLKNYTENANSYKQLMNPDYQPEFNKSELESLWCLVDYSAMSKKVLNSDGDNKAPAWFDFDFGSATGVDNDHQPPADAISRDVIMSLFDEPYLLSTTLQLLGNESSSW